MNALKLGDVPVYWYNPSNHSLEHILNVGMKREIVEQLPQVKSFSSVTTVIIYQSDNVVAVNCVPQITMLNVPFKDKYARAFLVMNGCADFCATIQTSQNVNFEVVCKNGGVRVTAKRKEIG